MTIVKFVRNAAAAALLTAGMSVSANAASLTFSVSEVFISPPNLLIAQASRTAILNDTSGTLNGSIAVSRFNPALGVLNSITLNINHGINTEFVDIGGSCIANNPTCVVDIERRISLSASYSAGGGSNPVANNFRFSPTSCELGGSCIGFVDNRDFRSNSTRDITDAADLAEFSGPGDFTVDLTMLFSLDVSPGLGTDTVLLGASYDWDGEVTVTYDYTEASTEIPAPAGAAFLLMGVMALARRKRG